MDDLPTELTEGAFRAEDGEYAWKRNALPEVLNKIAALGFAILGGEVWAVHEGKIWGTIPTKDGGPSGVWHWEIERRSGETWADFCKRSAKESLRETLAMRVEDAVRSDMRECIYFNICWTDKRDV